MDKIFPTLKNLSSLYKYISTLLQIYPNELRNIWNFTDGKITRVVDIKDCTYLIQFSLWAKIKTLSISSSEMNLFIKFADPISSNTTKLPFMNVASDFYGFHKYYNFDFYHYLKFVCGNDSIYTEVQSYQKYYVNPTEDYKFNMNLSLHSKVIEQIEFNSKLKDDGINNIIMVEYQIQYEDIYSHLPTVVDNFMNHIHHKISGV